MVLSVKDPNPQQLSQTLVNWANAIAQINSYANSVNQVDVPPQTTLSRVDATTYTNLLKSLSKIKTDAERWILSIQVAINLAPQVILDVSSTVKSFMDTAIAAAEALQKDPTNQEALKNLNNSLSETQNTLENIITDLQNTINTVSNFQNSLEEDIQNYSDSINDFNTLYSDLQQDISNLNNQISQLNSSITKLQIAIAAEMVATGVSTIALATRIPLVMEWNPLVGGILIIGGFIAFSVAELEEAAQQSEITSMEKTIQDDASAQQEDTQAMVYITALNATLLALKENVTNLTTSGGPFDQIIQDIKLMKTETQSVVSDIQQALQDKNQQQFQQVINDLQNSENDWTQIQQTANNFANNLSFSIDQENAYVINNGSVTKIPANR